MSLPTNSPTNLSANATSFDLNLVRLLVAVFETGSVSKAAVRLGITQPSISYGLGRLRRAVGDPLFVRSAGIMTPSPVAEQLYRQFREALTAVESAIEGSGTFDSRTSHRNFRVAMSDVGAICLVPPLLAHLRIAAPEVTLEIVEVPVKDLMDDMARGKLDAAVGNLPLLHASARSEMLFTERYVCLLSSTHPRIVDGLSHAQFLAEGHVVVASPFSIHQNVEEALAERGVRRRAAVRIPHFTSLPAIIASSDLLVTLPSTLGDVFSRGFAGLRCVEMPVALPTFDIRLLWHARQQSNPSHLWLRQMLVKALSKVGPAPAPAR